MCGVGRNGRNANKEGCREQRLLGCREQWLLGRGYFCSGRELGPFPRLLVQSCTGVLQSTEVMEETRGVCVVCAGDTKTPPGVPGSHPAGVQGS